MKSSNLAAQSDIEIERKRLTSLINSMADGVIALDQKGRVIVSNGAVMNLLDINVTLTEKPIAEYIKLYDKNKKLVDFRLLLSSVKTVTTSRDYSLKYDDGSIVNLYISIAPVHSGFGQNAGQGYVMLLRDITHEKSLEDERNEFISVVSHELRTPIAIAEGNIGNAQFIVDKTGDILQVKIALSKAYEQITFLANMINDLSTLSRAQRNKLTLDVEPINAYELINELQNSYQSDAEKKHLTVSSVIDPHLELLYSSKLYVKEILQNFITNSLKYTESGGITIYAKPKNSGILFAIEDTGIGISKNDQKKVFDKFFRSEDYRTRQSTGTGLGLYITAKLAKLINAQITLESELNKGSIFNIFVPNLKPQKP